MSTRAWSSHLMREQWGRRNSYWLQEAIDGRQLAADGIHRLSSLESTPDAALPGIVRAGIEKQTQETNMATDTQNIDRALQPPVLTRNGKPIPVYRSTQDGDGGVLYFEETARLVGLSCIHDQLRDDGYECVMTGWYPATWERPALHYVQWKVGK